MRKLLLLFFIIPSVIIAQENFKTINNTLTWEKVFKSDLTSEEIKNILKTDPVLNPIAQGFTGQTIPTKINCEGTQAIFMRGQFQYFANIEFKEGRYRVQVSNIQILPETTIEVAGVRTTQTPEAYQDYLLKRDGSWRSNKMAQKSKECLDNHFLTIFDFKKQSKDW